LLLIQASLQVEHYIVAAIAVAVGLMTVYSMVKIWIKVFWKPLPSSGAEGAALPYSGWKMAPVCVLALITLLMGIGAEPVYRLADTAARELMAPQVYVEAVLGGGRP
jgi:multicomponent Na+:H+ antiporter subunit D